MNVFTGKRTTSLFIIALVLLNLALLATFWYTRMVPREEGAAAAKPVEQDKPGARENRNQENRDRRSERLLHFLQKELDFTQNQVDEFLRLRRDHFDKADRLQRRTNDLRKEMMDLLLEEEPDRTRVEKLAEAIGQKLAEHEKAVFEHFLQLETVCDAEQQVKYKRLLREILHQLGPPRPRAPHAGEGREPPPDRQHRGEHEMGAADHLERLRRELGLTHRQEETIRPILEAAMEKLRQIPNDPAYRGHPERREAAERVLQSRNRRIKDLLTEEQKQHFDRMNNQPPRGRR